MNNIITLVIFIFFTIVLTGCNDKPELTSPIENSLIQSIADDSFKENTIGARFIPVLDSAEDVKLGARFDTLTGQIVGSSPCIAEFKNGENGNEHYSMRLVEVSDSYSQMTALDIDVSVQGSYLGASANAKASFANKQEFSQQTQKFLLYAKAERKPKTIEPDRGTLYGLTDDAQKVLNDRQAFRDLCGDAFVVAIFEGIEMFAMLNFHNLSQTSQKKISGEMGGSYGGWQASTKATQAVNGAVEQNNMSLTVELSGRCQALDLSGDEKARWGKMVEAGSKLQTCSSEGSNITSYKVIPYSKAFIRDWPYSDDQDPEIAKVLFYHAAYGAVLDSINALLTNRSEAYSVALLDRGIELDVLDELASEIRGQRKALKRLLADCQSSSNPTNRAAVCKDENSLRSQLDEFVHPYVYRAQLPLYFVGGKPEQAFWANEKIKSAVLNENVQHPRDVACQFADKAKLDDFGGCPDNYNSIKSEAEKAIYVADFPWPLNQTYMFQTLSTSTNLCMVAPNPKTIVKASPCNYAKPSSARQRMNWLSTGQLRYRQTDKEGALCVQGRDSAKCDSVKYAQLWRFVPSQSNRDIGLIQNAEGKCLIHSNVDKNVRYGTCYGGEREVFYQWKPIVVK